MKVRKVSVFWTVLLIAVAAGAVKCNINSDLLDLDLLLVRSSPLGPDIHLSDTDYQQMPALHKLDEYDRCLDDYEFTRPAIYCLVKTVIKPDNDSDVWRLIQQHSRNRKMNFRHEILERGICMKPCRELVERLHPETKKYLYQAEFDTDFKADFKLTLPAEYFRNTLAYRELYSTLINQCVNFELRNNHNLSGFSQIEYCVSSEDAVEYDLMDFVFFAAVLAVILIVVCSTSYDMTLKKTEGIEHYTSTLPNNTNMLLVSFSLPRNWYSLTIEKSTPLARDLRFIHTQRFIAMMLVIFSHSFFINNIIPVKNTQDVEENFSTSLIGAIDWIRLYFVLSAFLITILFMDDTHTKTPENANFRYFLRGMIERYTRLTPVYAFVILFHSTMLLKMGDGPVWNKYLAIEHANCRKNWWTNLLFINNYVNVNEPCVLEGWYLGADFQLFIFARFIRLMIWKYPKFMKYILGIGIALSYVIVGLVTYYKELYGAVVISLEAQKQLMIGDSNFLDAYIPTHMHFGNTLIGILGGIIYYQLRQQKFNAKENKIFNISWHFTGPILLLVVFISRVFYLYEFETPSLWMAVSAAFLRHLWAWLFVAIFIGLAFQVNDYIARFYNYPAFRMLGRISYCVYLCHVSIMAMITLGLRDPKYFTSLAVHLNFITAFSLSCVMGLILCLTIELPTAAMYKQLNNKK